MHSSPTKPVEGAPSLIPISWLYAAARVSWGMSTGPALCNPSTFQKSSSASCCLPPTSHSACSNAQSLSQVSRLQQAGSTLGIGQGQIENLPVHACMHLTEDKPM